MEKILLFLTILLVSTSVTCGIKLEEMKVKISYFTMRVDVAGIDNEQSFFLVYSLYYSVLFNL